MARPVTSDSAILQSLAEAISSDDEDFGEVDDVFNDEVLFHTIDEAGNDIDPDYVPPRNQPNPNHPHGMPATDRNVSVDSDSEDEIEMGNNHNERQNEGRYPRVRGRRNVIISNEEAIVNGNWRDLPEIDDAPLRFPFTTNNPGSQVRGMNSPLDYFKLFFTEELIEGILTETNSYANQRIRAMQLKPNSIWSSWQNVTLIEMKAFIGVVLNMGIVDLPNLQDYWSQDYTCKIEFFHDVFSRKRFLQIFWMLHLHPLPPAELPTSLRTRTDKIRHFLFYLEMKFQECFIPGQEISIDESTIGFKGKISFKTFNPLKPTKWGIRVYVLADANTSYIYGIVPYFGKITTADLVRPEQPFTTRIVLHLYEKIREKNPTASGYHIFTDRFYTSIELSKELYKLKCHLTGTIMPRRKGIPQKIRDAKIFKVGEKLACRNEESMLLAWKDKRVVTMLSSWGTPDSKQVQRYARSGVESEVISKPSVILHYNSSMNGVDVADQLTGSYCFLRKSLKWWRKLFFWGLEVASVNAYILYKEDKKNNRENCISHLKFKKKILMELVGDQLKQQPKSRKRGRPSDHDKPDRLNGHLHLLHKDENKKTKDCTVCSQRKIPGGRRETQYFCKTCERKPGLHPGLCFEKYHTLLQYK